MELSRPHIVAASILTFTVSAFLLSRVEFGKSVPTPISVAPRHAKPAPPVARVGLRAHEYLTDPLLVEVTGRDFVWHFRYSGPDGMLDTSDDVSASDELHLPSEHEIRFVVLSEDYIYYLSAPELGLRQIAVPELRFEKTFRTTQMGVFDLQVDPMCGMRYLHERSMGRVIVQPKSRFVDWLSGCSLVVPALCPEEGPSSR